MDQRLLERKDIVAYTAKQVALAVVLTNLIVIPTALVAYGGDFEASVNVGFVFRLSLVTGTLAAASLTLALSYRSARLFNELADARKELHRLSRIDPLTGLLNRRGFHEIASVLVDESNKSSAPVSVMMCDIDRFKSINDRYGHEFGDAVLVRISAILRVLELDENATVCRYGGEEFAVLLPDLAAADAERLAEQLRETCAVQLVSTPTATTSVTVSIGVATSSHGELSDLLRVADEALYTAKGAGRNRVVVADEKGRVAMRSVSLLSTPIPYMTGLAIVAFTGGWILTTDIFLRGSHPAAVHMPTCDSGGSNCVIDGDTIRLGSEAASTNTAERWHW